MDHPEEKPRILVVDDEPQDLLALQELLAERYEVLAAGDAEHAFGHLEDPQLTVILSDQFMPGMSGAALLHRARETSAATRVLMTGHSGLDAVTDAINQGQIFGFVRKPIDGDELFGILQQSVENHRLRRQRESAEVALRESEARYRAIFQDSPIGIARVDREGRYLDTNRALQEMFQLSAEQLLDRAVFDLTHEEDVAESRRLLERLVQTEGAQLGIVKRYLRSDGEVLWARVVTSAVHDPEGSFRHLITMVQDITDLRRLEEQFLHAQRMEAIGRLAGGVAHDFNNLLTGIAGFVELVLARGELDESDAADLRQVDALVQRGTGLTRQLLAVSRRQALRKQRLDLRDQLRDEASMLDRLLGKSIQLELELPPSALWVEVDPQLLGQVLMNLAVNSRDAMPSGGVLRISGRSTTLDPGGAGKLDLEEGDYAQIVVSDTGEGIPPAVLPRIFEPFFTTKADAGTGFGLPTVYGIVHQHRGAVAVASSASGTTFTVYLPLTSP